MLALGFFVELGQYAVIEHMGTATVRGENKSSDNRRNRNSIIRNHRNSPAIQIDSTAKMKCPITRPNDPREREKLKYTSLSINSHYSCSCHRNCHFSHDG